MFRMLRWRMIAAVVGGAIVASAMVAPSATAAVEVGNVPMQGWSVDGQVYATTVVDGVVYVGGDFSTVSSSGETVPRAGLAAFDLSDGSLITGFRADTNGTVRTIAASGSSLYIGGSFTRVTKALHLHVAKLDAGSGAVDAGFQTSVNAIVRTVVVQGSRVVVGGGFTKANGAKALSLVKVDGQTGSTVKRFKATTNAQVWAATVSPDGARLYISGSFRRVNGHVRKGVAVLDVARGVLLGPKFAFANSGLSLSVSPDGTQLFAALGGLSNSAMAWNAATGGLLWRVRFQGDAQAVDYHDGTVYAGFHDGYQGNRRLKVLALDAATGDVDPVFQPVIRTFLGVRSIDATANGVVIGGAFTSVAGVADRGFAIFH